jgi:hypothetical protein
MIASADIVDYNKEFSAQALVADAGSLWLVGMAFGGAVGLTGAVAQSAFAAAGRGVTSKAASTFARDVADHAVRRYSYIGTGPVEGAFKASVSHRVFKWLAKGANSKWARVATGEVADQYRGVAKTYREVGKGFNIASKRIAAQDIKDSARILLGGAPDEATARMLQNVINKADDIINAKVTLEVTRKHMQSYAHAIRDWVYKPKGKVIYDAKKFSSAAPRIEDAAAYALKGGNAELSATLRTIAKDMRSLNNGQKLTEKLFEARKAVVLSNDVAATSLAGGIDDMIKSITKGDVKVKLMTDQFDQFTKSFNDLVPRVREIKDPSNFLGGRDLADYLAATTRKMDDAADAMNMNKLTRGYIRGDAEVHLKSKTIDALEAMSDMNTSRRAILFNEGSGFGSVAKMPTGAAGELTFGNELLETQVGVVSDFKRSTGGALRYLTLSGAPRGASTFGGVLAYRAMTQEEKRLNFESAREIVLETTASPERMIEAIGATAGKLAATDMKAATAYSLTLATSQGYLLQQMPRSSDPLIGPRDYSMQEIDSYLETIGALESPASVIASAKDGSVSIEAVDAIRTVYPELYTDMVLDMVEFMQTRDWDKLNEAQRLGLDTFTGGALGVLQTYGPMPGPLFAQTPMQQQALGKNTQQSSPQMAHQQSQMNSTGSQKVSGL